MESGNVGGRTQAPSTTGPMVGGSLIFRVPVLGFRVQGLGFRVQGSGLWV